jgi:cell division protein FtsA
VAVYEEGDILYSSVIPVGAGHITNDLAIGLKTSIDAAEKIKLKHVRAHTTKANMAEKIRIEELDDDDNLVTRKQLQNIAGARLDEIFHLVRLELRKVGKDVMLPGGVVLTGGGAKMAGIEELAKEALQLPATVGKPEGFTGIVDRINDPAFAAPIGLMLENMSHGQEELAPGAGIGQTVDKIKGIFKHLLP